MTFPSRSIAFAFLLAACSTSQSSNVTDAGGATPADGGGVCCPVGNDFCCAADTGGWAQTASQCPTSGSCDGVLYPGTDEHGCAFVRVGAGHPGAVCCGCPTSDAGDAGDQ